MASRRLLGSLHRQHLPRSVLRMPAATFLQTRCASNFDSGPSPPRLPPDQQAEFERLQRAALSRTAFEQSSPPPSHDNAQQTSATLSTGTSRHVTTPDSSSIPSATTTATGQTSTSGESEATPTDGVWRGAPPEFDGDVNPKTGEVGGPKVEPLRWGSKGDWSYNGRVTDF